MHADGHDPRTGRDDTAHSLDLEGVDPPSAQVFRSFRRAARLHRHLMLRAFAEQGTPPGQAMCLRIVAVHDGATQREIGERLHLAPPTVTSMLKRMEKSGTISREDDPADQRVTRVRLTPRGRALDRELRGVLATQVGALLDAMPEADRRDLARLLDDLADRMAEALDEADAATPPSEGSAAEGSAR
jgi:DNA-binding MarR family transcriptional regulator